MIRKMRWSFIRVSMVAFFCVILLVAGVINIQNYRVTALHQDQIIEGIYEAEQRKRPVGERKQEDGEKPGFPEFEQPGRKQSEFAYTTRFFIVCCDTEGSIRYVSRDFVSSVSEETAREYGKAVLERGRINGYYRQYRYRVFEREDGKMLVFLNSEEEFQFMENLLVTSAGVVASGLALIFLLSFLLSKRAVAPFVRNLEQQKRFITDAGHELKTPITSISTSADVLQMLHGEEEWTENIRKQTDRLAGLVEDLIMLSRLDEETPFPEKADFSLSEAAWEIAQPFDTIARAQGRDLVIDIGDDICFLGERISIQKMMSILLDNAVKYSDGKGEIHFSVYEKRGKKYIETINTCRMMDQEELSRLFERFYRPDTSRSKATGGTGIGLAIARAVVQAHGGKIEAVCSDGKSIRFQVVLP